MRKLKNRLAVLRLLLVLLFCAVAVYLAWLMQKPELLQAAAGQGSYTCTAGTAAGTIYDRNGVPLVNTKSVCTAVVSPTPEAAEALLPHVLDAEAFYEKLAQGKPFTCTVDTADIACPDVTVLEIPQRYTTPQPAQHVIGYTQEGKGVAGLESAYDAVLRGVDSQWSVTFSVDGKGKPLAGEAAQVRYGANPVQGVMTTLDIRMQRICETAGASLQKGCVVVMDVESGDILGLASFPGYTPDALGEAMQDPDSPMIQRALYAYPVGSIFKLVTAACAYENGAEIRNLHLIQFHPTAFNDHHTRECFLISEAVRGEGAYLLNCNKERFMDRYDERLELAPRDVVSHAIILESRRTHSDNFYLDISYKDSEFIKNRFPMIYEKVLEQGYDMTKEPIPIFPCQHYLMGGIQVDDNSETTVPNLYAAGECSHTGVHGNNRLASNSLLEALVFSRQAALDIAKKLPDAPKTFTAAEFPTKPNPQKIPKGLRTEIRQIMQDNYFVIPNKEKLPEGFRRITEIRDQLLNGNYIVDADYVEAKSLATVAYIILKEVL